MEDLIIYGAGGLGRELLEVVEEINAESPAWRILGFADDEARGAGEICGYPALGGFDFLRPRAGRTGVLLAFADCAAKEAVYKKIKELCPGFYFPVIAHPRSYVSPRASLGEGAVVARFCSVHAGARLGRCVFVNNKCEIGHDSVIGDFSSLMPSVNICGNVMTGERVYFGVRSAVMQGLTFGADSVAGMGSVVLAGVPEGCTVLGNPAKIISRRVKGDKE